MRAGGVKPKGRLRGRSANSGKILVAGLAEAASLACCSRNSNNLSNCSFRTCQPRRKRFNLQFRESEAAVPITRLIEVEQYVRCIARGNLAARSWIYASVMGRDAMGVHRTNVVPLGVTASTGVT